ncbi:MAG: hypothetical protein ACD_28C00075G0005 [uncultured bacterium]|nr:MAG: hypothetical protein ACD_28C00075G0005 [uncultured bacterium]KKT72645.1 MAG: hypothetical protein UW70_C0104G0005 [Candidatus Peregrinibacteria bacterium GW2011_GWA2_44_7]
MNRFFKPLAITGLLVLTGLLAFGCGQKEDDASATQEELNEMSQQLDETTQLIEDNEDNLNALSKEADKLEDL